MADEGDTGLGTPPLLDCPRCRLPMAWGMAAIAATTWGFLSRGLSAQRMWFQRDGVDEQVDILDASRSVAAQHCARCGTLVLFTRR